jgi:predicted Mrr-cat superfamily restriction endonuclease
LPENVLVTPHQATMEAIKWLERLKRDEFSSVTRADLNVRLSPIEIEKRIVKYGDFSQQNQKINTELSETTRKRLQNNPEEWLEYFYRHRAW